jgi:hypothetical protein
MQRRAAIAVPRIWIVACHDGDANAHDVAKRCCLVEPPIKSDFTLCRGRLCAARRYGGEQSQQDGYCTMSGPHRFKPSVACNGVCLDALGSCNPLHAIGKSFEFYESL